MEGFPLFVGGEARAEGKRRRSPIYSGIFVDCQAIMRQVPFWFS